MKKLLTILPKKSGRSRGTITVRHQGGRQKRFLREVDFKRKRKDVWGTVYAIEYDPNRNAFVALVFYENGEKGYILSPLGLKEGQKVMASVDAPIEVGNALPIGKLPIGTQIHNLEIRPGKGGQLVKGAGSVATIQGREDKYVLIKLPSGETKRFDPMAWATVGQMGNIEKKTENLGKAGRSRRMGIRPTVRGVAQHPNAHPHGGGEGRSGVGMKYPKTPYGKPAVGKTRRKGKYSDKLIVSERKRGPHH